MNPSDDQPITALVAHLRNCQSVVVISGAGVSAESGIGTFRGLNGYWNKYRAEELASPQGFARDPALVWRWYDERRRQVLAAEPNPAHQAIVELEQHFKVTVITQNVDELHQRAGSHQVIPLHGSILRVRCTASGQEWPDQRLFEDFPVKCKCGALLRPGVLWFGENYDIEKVEAAAEAVENADGILVVGTSAMVWIVSGLLGYARGAKIAEFNLESTELSEAVNWSILGHAGETLPQVLVQLKTA